MPFQKGHPFYGDLSKLHFQKGNIPWNKGKKGLQISFWKGKKRSKETRKKISEARKKITGWHHTKETKRKISKAVSKPRPWQMGKNNPAWKGGITSLVRLIRHCFYYKQWRKVVFQRDNYICQLCGRNGYLEADHHPKLFIEIIKENNIQTLEEALNCLELWNVNNGRTLCKKCHLKQKRST